MVTVASLVAKVEVVGADVARGALLGLGAVVAGVTVGMGVMAVKAAADFQQGLNRLVTGAGDTTDNM